MPCNTYMLVHKFFKPARDFFKTGILAFSGTVKIIVFNSLAKLNKVEFLGPWWRRIRPPEVV